ncbi:MAG: hypothetical protein NC081_04400 [Roseburia sp.]|nr:hypothetical protein [Roseburia sp.]
MKKQYSESTYDIFYRWLKNYVKGWGDCDDFCTHAFGELLRQRKFGRRIMENNADEYKEKNMEGN